MSVSSRCPCPLLGPMAATLLLGTLTALAEELLIGCRVDGGGPTRPVVLREARRVPLVRTGPRAGTAWAAGHEPGDRAHQRKQQHEHEPADLGQMADLAVTTADHVDDAEDPQQEHERAEEDRESGHGVPR